MKIFQDEPGEDAAREDPGLSGESAAVRERGPSRGIWALAVANLLLACLSFLGLRFLAGAERYLINDSVEFGSDLRAALAGLLVLRILAYFLAGGFLVSALGMISLTRLGWRLQKLWALLLCLTLVGLVYSIPVLVFMRQAGTRSRFFS